MTHMTVSLLIKTINKKCPLIRHAVQIAMPIVSVVLYGTNFIHGMSRSHDAL